MRCVYCRPAALRSEAADATLAPSGLQALVQHLVLTHGLRKVRLTGGEPTARADLPGLVRFAAERGLEIRFIELMPMGPLSRPKECFPVCR